MYYSDLFPENFLVDDQGQIWVVDFAHAGVLPESFMSYAIDTTAYHRSAPIPPHLREKIPIARSENLKAMLRAAYVITISNLSRRVIVCFEIFRI